MEGDEEARRCGHRVVAFEDSYFTLLPGDARVIRCVLSLLQIKTQITEWKNEK